LKIFATNDKVQEYKIVGFRQSNVLKQLICELFSIDWISV